MATHELAQPRPYVEADAAQELDVASPTGEAFAAHHPFVHQILGRSLHKSKRKGTASQRGYGPDPGHAGAPNAIFRAYMNAADWELDVSDDSLAKQAVSDRDVERLRSGENDVVVGADGKIYRKDPDSPGRIIGYDPSKLPATEAFRVAQTTPMDYFVAHYRLAKTEPMQAFHDLITGPRNKVDYARADLHRTEWQLAMRPLYRTAKKDVEAAQAKLDEALRAQAALARQFYIMRNDVFHTDVAEQRAANRLRDQGFDTTQFHQDAKFKCTPDQIRELEEDYIAKFPAKVAGTPRSNPSESRS